MVHIYHFFRRREEEIAFINFLFLKVKSGATEENRKPDIGFINKRSKKIQYDNNLKRIKKRLKEKYLK